MLLSDPISYLEEIGKPSEPFAQTMLSLGKNPTPSQIASTFCPTFSTLCPFCNSDGKKQVGIKLNGTNKEVSLDNFHKTIGEQQDYVQMVYEEFQKVARDDRVYIENTTLKRQQRDPESAVDFVEYFKTRLCVQTL